MTQEILPPIEGIDTMTFMVVQAGYEKEFEYILPNDMLNFKKQYPIKRAKPSSWHEFKGYQYLHKGTILSVVAYVVKGEDRFGQVRKTLYPTNNILEENWVDLDSEMSTGEIMRIAQTQSKKWNDRFVKFGQEALMKFALERITEDPKTYVARLNAELEKSIFSDSLRK